MPDPRELLVRLLDYIKEQAKDVDPKGYRLTSTKNFIRLRKDIAGLPGIEFDIRLAGDHVWLRVPRLPAEPPPDPLREHKALFRVSADPNGPTPFLDEAALGRQINGKIQELKRFGVPSAEDLALARRDSGPAPLSDWPRTQRSGSRGPRANDLVEPLSPSTVTYSPLCTRWKQNRRVNPRSWFGEWAFHHGGSKQTERRFRLSTLSSRR